MSQATFDDTKEFAKRAVTLLEEFTTRLRQLTEEAFRIAEDATTLKSSGTKPDDPRRRRLQSRFDVLQQVFHRLSVAASNLARVVSQRVEHGKLDELDQAELQLRLAEFEGTLFAAQKAVLEANQLIG